MRKGDIVRKISCDGKEIGTFLKVLSCKQDFVSVQPISKRLSPFKAIKARLRVIKMHKIQINDSSYKSLHSGKRTISHSATAAWMKVYKECASLIQFRNFDFSEDIMIFRIENVTKRKDLWRTGEEIYITLGERLL